jgi:hypothetical protein
MMYLAKAICPKGYEYPWKHNDTVLILGEVANMPNHVAVSTKDGKVYWCYDKDSFRRLTEEET